MCEKKQKKEGRNDEKEKTDRNCIPQELQGGGRNGIVSLYPHGQESKEMSNRETGIHSVAAPSRGRYANSGNGPSLCSIDIGHAKYIALIAPDTAFWALIPKNRLIDTLSNPDFLSAGRRKTAQFAEEMRMLRFGLKPSAVYFNATERCNLNCAYCYIPARMRRHGKHMSVQKINDALHRLKVYFNKTVPEGVKPQIVFHGAEPMLNREAIFAAIEKYRRQFRFGIQTNATLLDDDAITFLKTHGVGIGISLDGHTAAICDRTRTTWKGIGIFARVVAAMDKLRGYERYNVICTITRKNVRYLTQIIDFLHAHEVPVCLLNIVRCTLPAARGVKPSDQTAAKYFIKALERTHALYRETNRKLVVANFANVLVSIIAPTARRLMCDISPCGGGRCFFALAPNGDLFPCSEFIGLPAFKGGNLFKDDVAKVLESAPFKMVTERKVEDIEPCQRCAIKHFCGAPCPAEAHEVNGGLNKTGSFCEFYEEQVRYAFRLIADGKQDAFLWDGWDKGTRQTFKLMS